MELDGLDVRLFRIVGSGTRQLAGDRLCQEGLSRSRCAGENDLSMLFEQFEDLRKRGGTPSFVGQLGKTGDAFQIAGRSGDLPADVLLNGQILLGRGGRPFQDFQILRFEGSPAFLLCTV